MDFDFGDFFSDPLGSIGSFFSTNPLGGLSLLGGLGASMFGGLLGGKKKPDLPVMPNPPSASDAAAKAARILARKRASEQQGMEDTILTGSLGIAPGLKPTLG